MSDEVESDRAMARNLESLESMVLVTMRPRPSRHWLAKFDKPAVRIMFQVTQIARFLLERGLRFRNLGFCGHDLM
jgi:Cys-tRNA synthase (O-phospho-L-seryl-tRNA:Cys-tRNA synthase)